LYEIEKAKDQSAYLFTPKPTYLLQSGYYGKSKTQGENHPNGAIINYYLKEVDTTQTYTLEVFDHTGRAVRSFSNKAKKGKNTWEPKAGANRFIWDLREQGVEKIDGMILWFALSDGPYVLPGNYRVVLTAGAEVREATLTLQQDPRSKATLPDLQAQHEFIATSREKMNAINKTIREIRKVNAQLADAKTKINDDRLIAEIDSLITYASNIEKALYQTQNRSSQDPLNYPIRLNNKYGHVLALATIGFNRPTASMYEVKQELEVLINAELHKWEGLKPSLHSLNAKIRESETPFITW
jgi:hypothetical protein